MTFPSQRPSAPSRPALSLPTAVARPIASVVALATGFLMMALPALTQEIVSASPDVTIEIGGGGTVVSDEDVALDNQLGIVLIEDLGSIPGSTDVIAMGLDLSGARLIAVDVTTSLAGGVVARPGDVVRYDGLAYSIVFDADAAGLPAGVMTDAASIAPSGLLLSFDTTVDLGGGVVAADEDLVLWDGAAFSLRLDGSAAGIPTELDVDAAQDLGGGSYLMSFDTTGSLGGVVFADEDVLRFDGSSWTLEFDASVADADWEGADLDAMVIPEPGFGLLVGLGAPFLALLPRRRR